MRGRTDRATVVNLSVGHKGLGPGYLQEELGRHPTHWKEEKVPENKRNPECQLQKMGRWWEYPNEKGCSPEDNPRVKKGTYF